ncbi:hypothetical protein, partial [Nocardia sp. No.11]|uniref:hypothetical protein n=1 Tax=Nocardia sp. No.11 TaxID=3128861 RepID=UPI00319EA5D1
MTGVPGSTDPLDGESPLKVQTRASGVPRTKESARQVGSCPASWQAVATAASIRPFSSGVNGLPISVKDGILTGEPFAWLPPGFFAGAGPPPGGR